jgi:ribonuclease-3
LGLKFPIFRKKKSTNDLYLIRFILIRFGYRPKKIAYFIQAISHKSIINPEVNTSNERLEFLGDAILDAVVAEYLFQRFPGEDEGYLTKIKSKIVNRKTLAEIAEKMELREIIRYHKGRSINLPTIEGNALEAIFGAIYLDGGFQAVKNTVQHHVFRKYINVNKVLEEEIDFKSKLFIWCQRNHLQIEFEIISEENNQNVWTYTIQVSINNTKYGKGSGSSKKTAEQAAAKETLELMGEF